MFPGSLKRQTKQWSINTEPKLTHKAIISKDHDRSEGLCRSWPGHLEQPPRRPADFITVQRYICDKTQNTFIWLPALLRSSLIGHYTNWHIHSFIHSFISHNMPH